MPAGSAIQMHIIQLSADCSAVPQKFLSGDVQLQNEKISNNILKGIRKRFTGFALWLGGKANIRECANYARCAGLGE